VTITVYYAGDQSIYKISGSTLAIVI